MPPQALELILTSYGHVWFGHSKSREGQSEEGLNKKMSVWEQGQKKRVDPGTFKQARLRTPGCLFFIAAHSMPLPCPDKPGCH